MADPNFTNLLFTWLLYAFPILYTFHYREWSHRYAIWTALWITLTPVDPNPLMDLIWMITLFRVAEEVTARVLNAEMEWKRRRRVKSLKAR